MYSVRYCNKYKETTKIKTLLIIGRQLNAATLVHAFFMHYKIQITTEQLLKTDEWETSIKFIEKFFCNISD